MESLLEHLKYRHFDLWIKYTSPPSLPCVVHVYLTFGALLTAPPGFVLIRNDTLSQQEPKHKQYTQKTKYV